jgi:thioredoxin
MSVKEIPNDAAFRTELQQAGSKLVCVDFFATWCGPCNVIAPFIKQLASKYPNAVFLKVDVDKCEQLAHSNNVSAMPTFILFKNSIELERIRGADKQTLEDKIKQHVTSSVDSLTSDNGDISLPNGFIDLYSMINKQQSECLNQCDDHTWENILNNSKLNFLKSDCDEQLLLVISFQQPIRLHSLVIQGPKDNGPKLVKLFINQTRTLDFDSAERMEPVQLLELKEDDLINNQLINLRYVKFQNVQSLTIFFANNQSNSDTTVIHYLKLVGQPVSVTNMNEFKRVSGQPGESHG